MGFLLNLLESIPSELSSGLSCAASTLATKTQKRAQTVGHSTILFAFFRLEFRYVFKWVLFENSFQNYECLIYIIYMSIQMELNEAVDDENVSAKMKYQSFLLV